MASYLGIDPGINGGLAIIANGAVHTLRMPTMQVAGKNRPDLHEIERFVWRHAGNDGRPTCALEVASVRPGGSIASGLQIGTTWGMLLALPLLHNWPLLTVTPKRWTQALHGGGYKGKQTTIDWCRVTYPAADLIGSAHPKAKPHDGICDALALAHYARERNRT